jgi:hypothetical protein
MDVEIGQLNSTVRAVDGNALLTPQVMQTILSNVMEAIKEQDARERRAGGERRVTGGVSAERDQER